MATDVANGTGKWPVRIPMEVYTNRKIASIVIIAKYASVTQNEIKERERERRKYVLVRGRDKEGGTNF